MRELRVALAQVNPTVGDLSGNAALIKDYFGRAAEGGADMVAFPELAITGYPPEDLLLKPSFVRQNLEILRDLAKTLKGPAAVIGFVDHDKAGRLYNAAAVVAGGRVRGVYHKEELPNYGVFDEKRYFAEGTGLPLFVIRGVQIGVTVCEDAWIGDGPVQGVARNGAEVVLNINASPYHRDKSFERQVLFRQRARDNKVFFLYVQTVGGQDELVFDGDSLTYAPDGRLLVRGAQFEEELVLVDIELPDKTRRIKKGAEVVQISKASARKKPPLPERHARRGMDRVEEVYSALQLGTRDYIRKNGFASVVMGLSGGIDSSLTAVIAADAIGAENVVGIAMPSEISSSESLEDAKELATNLGIQFDVLAIAGIQRAFMDALADPFAGTKPGLAEENLQARIRGTILMALSNKFGHLVLTTGNKSEMATGYSTLYGDMAGGFAVLKDVPKTLVYELSAWRNSYGLAAIPDRVFTKPPSAELRLGQTDQDELPPYDELDPILSAYVEEDRSIREMIALGYDEKTVRKVVEMVDRSEYKRRQAPPGVKITARAFGKDRRLPITNRFRQPVEVPERVTGRRRR
ncbi:MAG: NAD+ synthase [Actinobacteria bacterium]|nr:MAG: NAD+ synthase [Actinomycetota bacterium]